MVQSPPYCIYYLHFTFSFADKIYNFYVLIRENISHKSKMETREVKTNCIYYLFLTLFVRQKNTRTKYERSPSNK